MCDGLIHILCELLGVKREKLENTHEIIVGLQSGSRLKSNVYKFGTEDKKYILKAFDKNIDISLLNSIHNFVSQLPDKGIIASPIKVNDQFFILHQDILYELYDYIDHDQNDKYSELYNGFGSLNLKSIVTGVELLGKYHHYSHTQSRIINRSVNKDLVLTDDYLISSSLFLEYNKFVKQHKSSIKNFISINEFIVGRYIEKMEIEILQMDKCNVHGDYHINNILFKNSIARIIIDIHSITSDVFYIDLARYIYQTCFFDANGTYISFNRVLCKLIVSRYSKKNDKSIDYKFIFGYLVLFNIERINIEMKKNHDSSMLHKLLDELNSYISSVSLI